MMRAMRCISGLLAFVIAGVAFASSPKAVVLTLDGVVGPATADYTVRGIRKAHEQQGEAHANEARASRRRPQ